MKVVLAGYYGFGNAGDELILQSIVEHLKKSGFSLANLTVLSKTPFRIFVDYGVKSVNRWSAFAVLRAIMGCDLFVLGGGGLLQDSTGRFGLWYYLLLLWLAIFCRKKVAVLAVGVGPLEWGVNKKLVAFTLRHMDTLTLRDGVGVERGIPLHQNRGFSASLQTVADPVFCLQLGKFEKKEKVNGGKRKICLVLRSGKQTKQMAKVMAEFSRKISKELRGEICLLPFHPALDCFAIQSFLKEFHLLRNDTMNESSKRNLSSQSSVAETISDGANENVNLESDAARAELPAVSVLEWSNLDELIRLFSGMELVVSFRYHAIVLAAMMEIPVLGISADPKISNLMQNFFGEHGMKNWLFWEECDSERVLSLALELWKNREKFQEIVNENLPRYRENALRGLKYVLC